MNLTKNERAALHVVNRYRRRVDKLEDEALRGLAKKYIRLEKSIRRDLKDLQKAAPSNISLLVRYRSELEPVFESRIRAYANQAEETMISLSRETARLGAKTADRSAKKIMPDRTWAQIKTSGIVSGPLLKASREAIRKLPGAITQRISDLVGQAVGMAEQGLDWVMSQLSDTLSGLWSSVRRTVQTLAEQMFRRAQQQQAQRTPVTKWLRLANHETACFACLMLEGTIYDRREDFADHPNGRCTITPIEGGHRDEHPGRDWFEQQDPETQRRILGKTRYEAWQNGEIILDDMVEVVNDPVYGPIPHMIQLLRLGLTR